MNNTTVTWPQYATLYVAALLTSGLMILLYTWLHLKIFWLVAFWLVMLLVVDLRFPRKFARFISLGSLVGLSIAGVVVQYVIGL